MAVASQALVDDTACPYCADGGLIDEGDFFEEVGEIDAAPEFVSFEGPYGKLAVVAAGDELVGVVLVDLQTVHCLHVEGQRTDNEAEHFVV